MFKFATWKNNLLHFETVKEFRNYLLASLSSVEIDIQQEQDTNKYHELVAEQQYFEDTLNKLETTYSLFEGRHELPFHKGAIFSHFGFNTKEGVKTKLYDELLSNGGMLIVTGLTPALTQFLSEFSNSFDFKKKKLILLHFDSNTKQYWEQVF
jgi:hypothetical protein